MERLVIEHFEDRIRKDEYRGKRKLKQLPAHFKGRMLEIGCGARLTYEPKSSEVCGVDISLEMARHFIRNHESAQMILADARELPFKKGAFDVIVMNTVLHHLVGKTPRVCLHNVILAIGNAKRILKNSGVVFVVELIARNNLFSYLMFFGTVFLAKLGINIEILDIHSKVMTFFLTNNSLREIFIDAGFTVGDLESTCWRLRGLKLGRQVTYSLNQCFS